MEDSFIRAFWYLSNNFGDNLNHFLLKNIFKKEVVFAWVRDKPHLILCGSIISECNNWTRVIGAGLGAEYQRVNPMADIVVVRGHKTAELVNKDAAVGDPALVLPLFYQSKAKKQYDAAIIPHWLDYEYVIGKFPSHHIIDPFLPVKEFVDEVSKCDRIISSSLHGLIVADAYGVPNAWMDIAGGDQFKYHDYYTTTAEAPEKPLTELDWDSCIVHPFKYDTHELLNIIATNE